MKTQGTRAFCFEEEVGVIVEGQFYPIKFEPIRFMRIIVKLMHKKDYVTADLLLKDAIMEYSSATMLSKIFKTKNLSDSLFYMKWRNLIRKNKKFYQKEQILQKKRMEWHESKKRGQREGSVVREARRESFKRTLKRIAQY